MAAISLPPPVGGWDVRSALAEMPATNAWRMDNFFPNASDVVSRRGYRVHATGFASPVDTLVAYQPPSGSQRLFAASGTSIFDATASGAIGAAAATGFTSARWQHTSMVNSAGSFLLLVNGQDTPQLYNGSTWANTTISGTGLTVTALAWCGTHQRRWWFGEAASMSAWYLATDAITGHAKRFDLGSVATLGGYIMAMGTWTRDGGSGPDDLAVFVTSEGEVLIYSGTDPDNASTWALQGVFRIGRPLGRRCLTRAGADLLVMTQDGFISLASILPVDRAQQGARSLSAQINPAVTDAARLYAAQFGWQAFLYPRGAMCIFNVPNFSTFDQFVFNTTTAAPCRFTGIPARCWALLNENPYFGTSGSVCLFDVGDTDAGTPIDAVAGQAFNAFGRKAQLKLFRRVMPSLLSEAPPLAGCDVVIDYDTTKSLPDLQTISSTVARYDSATYDASVWAGPLVYNQWRSVRGRGRVGAIRLRARVSEAQLRWIGNNVLTVEGGTL